MTQTKRHICVAGVPRSCQNSFADGRWLTERHFEQINAVSPDIVLTHTTEKELLAGNLPAVPADILLIEASGDEPYLDEISAPNMGKLVTPNLKWVKACSSGVGHILDLGLLGDEVQLTNAAGVHASALGESVMAAILFHAKRLGQRIENQRQRNWHELHCSELTNQTMLIIGTGKIGTETAKRARAFGMRIIGLRHSGKPHGGFDHMYGPAGLHEALPQADYVVIACPLTPETIRMIGEPEFAIMKTNAYVINVARGKITDETALLNAVTSGQIDGAFLDALSQEPLPTDHPFWSTPGITLTPHDSHSSPLIGDNIVDLFVENLRLYLAGKPLRNLIDRQKGY